jgi:hypothetical protein
MTATDTSRESDRVECISEGHLEFMREYVRWEEERSKQAIDNFMVWKLRQCLSARYHVS